ncbi:DUF2207 domain-containing protein [Rhizobium sp. LjRoot30]|uniref:DUF2207 domain-containing protein n=1 Tax=Rhizobium sp. LjRoot30 TaxID=3342320 RepID=UPI003ECC2260
MNRLFLALLLMLAALAPLSPAMAEEYIRTYDADITLSRDGSMTVTETIVANAEGQEIRRGIFRDFPLTFINEKGRTAKVDFDIVSIERDGVAEDYHTESISGGIRIYIGKAEVFLPTGEHTFTITYRTDRQIKRFEAYDELFWNVTGNGWRFRIAEATATVRLPEGARAQDTIFFTGPLGATEKNATVQDNGGTVTFATTQPLRLSEGLTIGVKLAKGVIDPPTAMQVRMAWLEENLGYFIGFGGFAVVFFYYLRSWVRVGRDPSGGVMVPRWDAPDGISPALVNYIDNKGFSGQGWTALSATALSLAVKGYAVLEDTENSLAIRRTTKPRSEKLGAGEESLLHSLGGEGAALIISKSNGRFVKAAGDLFRSSIEREHRGKYYNANIAYIIGGVLISAFCLVGLLIFSQLSEEALGIFIGSLLIGLVVGVFSIPLGLALRGTRNLLGRILLILILGLFLFVGAILLFGMFVSAYVDLGDPHEYVPIYAAGGIVFLNVLFFFLMGAPTPIGSKMMTGIEGLRQYLTLAEKDRMNMAGAPTMSPQHFETMLPYAVALGVEKPWSKTFDRWLASAAAGAAATTYQPSWYSGSLFRDRRFSENVGKFSSSMASTIASTIPAPPRSSSSGSSSGFSSGGSSGGGGGGGGGGGW